MAARGIRELNLVAQDLTHYGIDTDYRENLEKLLPALCAVEGVDWIRLHYVYPDQLSDEVIDLIAREPKIVKYLDMPIQHTNDRVLKRMGRKLTKKRLFEVMGKLRDRVPGVAIRTSIIVGFPGETEEEFEELCRDLKTLDIEYVGVFRYSREDGTAADRLDGHLHPSTRRRRWRALESQLLGRAQERAAAQVGRKTVALFEGKSEESDLLFQARLPQQAQEIDGHVLINDLGDVEAEALSPGDLVELEITESLSKGLAHHLMGRVTRVASPWRAPI
jgi:ribosomal protein S12 methylthiotransferase